MKIGPDVLAKAVVLDGRGGFVPLRVKEGGERFFCSECGGVSAPVQHGEVDLLSVTHAPECELGRACEEVRLKGKALIGRYRNSPKH